MIPLAQKSSCIGAVCGLCKEIAPTFSILRSSGLVWSSYLSQRGKTGAAALVAIGRLVLSVRRDPYTKNLDSLDLI